METHGFASRSHDRFAIIAELRGGSVPRTEMSAGADDSSIGEDSSRFPSRQIAGMIFSIVAHPIAGRARALAIWPSVRPAESGRRSLTRCSRGIPRMLTHRSRASACVFPF
jgi:hypothetical protein